VRRQRRKAFHQLPQSSLETAEKLEQLRLLQNSIDIIVAIFINSIADGVGVDPDFIAVLNSSHILKPSRPCQVSVPIPIGMPALTNFP
jgi:CMP-2-keto-3-deoxyoctulosonic acid synthetase